MANNRFFVRSELVRFFVRSELVMLNGYERIKLSVSKSVRKGEGSAVNGPKFVYSLLKYIFSEAILRAPQTI